MSPNVIAIRNNQTSISMLNVGHQEEKKAGSNVLVFKKYGEQYFLHEIVCPMRTIDAKVPISQEEKKVAGEWASRGGDRPVLVALK